MWVSGAPTLRWITEVEKIEEVADLLLNWYLDQGRDCPKELDSALALLNQLALEIKTQQNAEIEV